MSITLDTIKLPNMIIEDELSWTGIEAAVELSLGGTPIIWEQGRTGKSLDLVSGEADADWISRKDLLSLQSLASVVSATYILSYEGSSITVRFRNEDDPVISATPIVSRSKKDRHEYYNELRIKLMEV